MKRKKILYVVEGFGGGVYTFMVQLANEMIKSYDITLAYSRRKETPSSINQDFNKKIKLIELNNSREINIAKDLKGFFIIRKLIKEEKPEVLHLHSSKAGFFGRIANRTVKGSKKRSVFYNPHGYSFLQTNISKGKKIMFRTCEWIASKFGGTIIAVSEGEGKEARKLSKKVKVINNSINILELNSFVIDNKNKDEKAELKIATLARICEQKNPKLFNDIAKITNKQFTWIGDGDQRNLIESENIEVTGWRQKEDGINILNNNDIFLLTSLWEGLPISLLEAMALRKVCIVTNVIGNKDVIINGKNGFIANSKEEFQSIIERLNNDRELYSKISNNAYKYVKENFNIKDMFANYKNAYSNFQVYVNKSNVKTEDEKTINKDKGMAVYE